MSNGQFALKFKNFKREAKLVDKRSTMSLNEMGKDAYYFSVVDLKDKFFDYTYISLTPEYSYKRGNSPFSFDDFNNDFQPAGRPAEK